jgi:hypothetical protein
MRERIDASRFHEPHPINNTRGRLLGPVRDNLGLWLVASLPLGVEVALARWHDRLTALCKISGLDAWPQNVLRHSHRFPTGSHRPEARGGRQTRTAIPRPWSTGTTRLR